MRRNSAISCSRSKNFIEFPFCQHLKKRTFRKCPFLNCGYFTKFLFWLSITQMPGYFWGHIFGYFWGQTPLFLGTDPTIANKIKGLKGPSPSLFLPSTRSTRSTRLKTLHPETKTRGVSAAGFAPPPHEKIFTRLGEEFLGARLIFQMPRMSQNSAGLTTKSTGG